MWPPQKFVYRKDSVHENRHGMTICEDSNDILSSCQRPRKMSLFYSEYKTKEVTVHRYVLVTRTKKIKTGNGHNL